MVDFKHNIYIFIRNKCRKKKNEKVKATKIKLKNTKETVEYIITHAYARDYREQC